MNSSDLQQNSDWDRFVTTLSSTVYILGKKYNTRNGEDLEAMKSDIESRLWFTYREGFCPIHGEKRFSSDRGWGCMHRSGQMMLAEALIRMHLTREWRWNHISHDQEYWTILKRFQDRIDAPYSIHSITSQGLQENKHFGEWFGPNTVAQILKKLSTYDTLTSPYIHITNENGIIIDQIRNACFSYKEEQTKASIENSTQSSPKNIVETVLPVSGENYGSLDDEMELIDMPADVKNLLRKPWDPEELPFTNSTSWHPMLLIIPLRLGIHEINPTYFEGLKAVFQVPQSVGILGGRPNKAHWSIGTMDDSLISLDPHFTQPAAIFTSNIPKESEDQTFHCRKPISTKIADLDPSLALGFYCADENSFLDLCRRLKNPVISKGSDVIVEVHDTLSCDFDGIDCDIDLDEDEFQDSPDEDAHDDDAVLFESSVPTSNSNPMNDPTETFDLIN